jgi:hypothetical protein
MEVKIFLDFIHARSRDKNNDLQTLFQDYLNYDLDRKTEENFEIRAKVNYLDKLNQAIQSKTNLKKLNHPSIFLYRQTNHEKVEDKKLNKKQNLKEFRRICKRNLIVIEILENFVIDDDNREDDRLVDVEKLKNLLPKTTIIDNAYMKRLMYTDINSLNKALTRLKPKDLKDQQEILLNKTVFITKMLNGYIDNQARNRGLSCSIDSFNRDDGYIVLSDEENEEKEVYDELGRVLKNVSLNIKTQLNNNIKSAIKEVNDKTIIKIKQQQS